jgi:hypothetical protein
MGVWNGCKRSGTQRRAAWNAALMAVATLAWLTAARAQSRTNFDLTIDAARLQASVVYRTHNFKAGDCALVEGCVGGTGKRNLMRFDVATPNVGTEDLVLGSPTDPNNSSLFVYSPCHGHYHLTDYALYELLYPNGSPVVVNGTTVVGHKQAFCLEDFQQVDPTAGPAKFTCAYQGISRGWEDVYGSYLDCQWIDVTGVPPGDYLLRVTINFSKILPEKNLSNNTATVGVHLPNRFG